MYEGREKKRQARAIVEPYDKSERSGSPKLVVSQMRKQINHVEHHFENLHTFGTSQRNKDPEIRPGASHETRLAPTEPATKTRIDLPPTAATVPTPRIPSAGQAERLFGSAVSTLEVIRGSGRTANRLGYSDSTFMYLLSLFIVVG